MITSHTTGPNDADRGSVGRDGGRGRGGGVLALLGALGSLLVVGAWVLPLWRATLHAPQYPDGLTMWAYGNKVTGDLNEINALNHYVGLGVFDPADVPEMQLWPLAVGAAIVAVLLATLLRRHLVGRLALVYLWALPFGVLGAIQFRLHEFGQDIAPGAAFRLEPFTPWVVGKTTVWNFETTAWPGWGLMTILAAAALLTFAPRWLDRSRGRDAARNVAVVALVGGILVGGPMGATAPAEAQHHDHGDANHDMSQPHGDNEHPGTSGSGDGPPAPDIGPALHPAMPALRDHPPAGDLDELLRDTEPGATLRLPAGSYTGPVVIDQPVVIEGDGYPIVQGDGTGSVITVRAPGTVIRGLVVRGSGPGPVDNPAGIRIEADDVTVEGVVVEDSYIGIAVDSAASARLVDNHIHGRAGAAIVDDGHATADDTDHSDHAGEADHRGHEDHGDHDHAGHDDHGGRDHAGHAEHDHDAHADHDHEAHADHAQAGHADHMDHDAAGHAGHDHAGHDHAGHGAAGGGDRPGATGSRGDAVWLHDVDHVLVRNNHIDHARDGIYVSFGSGAVIDSNHVHRSRYAIHTMWARDLAIVQNHFAHNLSGMVLMYGDEALLLRNHLESNDSVSTGFGIILKDIAQVEAVQNVIVDNRVGIHIDGPTDTRTPHNFIANTVARNEIGVGLQSSAKVEFSGNSFAANTVQVLPLGGRLSNVVWSVDGWGNYWSTYRGYDAHGEGRGAVAHTEGGAVDRLLGRNPELVAIAGSPAMRLLRSVEERWGSRDPAAVDELPLTNPLSPALPASAPEPAARNVGLLFAVLLLLPALALFVRPVVRFAAPSRRPVRVVSS